MSKIYDKYQKLKTSDNYTPNTLYLFKAGLFFIFIDEDAKIVSNLLNLKLGNLNDTIVKCGFPCNSLQKYLTLLKNTPYNVEIVSLDTQDSPMTSNNYLTNRQLKIIVDEIINLKIDDLSISQAYDFLYKIQDKLRTVK
ncbi:MAG: hypothetical protein V8R45_03935 [Clostridia bacterium]|mgnify:CR=1 FL=1